ncbi:R3H domain-containing nucleic acid-binding protein [Megasphaera sp. UPII 135-E]
MNGYERKIIHLALQHEMNVRTDSEGQEPYRHVVIHYEL